MFVILKTMKKLTTKKIIFLAYFLSLFILRKVHIFSFTWYFLGSFMQDLIFWLGGAFLGGYFIKIDQLIYVYFTHPDEPLSLEVKRLIKEKKRKEAWDQLRKGVSSQRLAFRSVLFQTSWIVLAFFTLTSTAGLFGKTMVMGIGLHLLMDEWGEIIEGRSISWLFWQVKREIAPKEQKKYLWIMTGVFGILSLLLA